MQELILDPYLRNALFGSIMDAAMLWATGAVTRLNPAWHRLLAGAAAGGIYNFWLGLAHDGYLPGWSLLSSVPVYLLLFPAIMLAVVFMPIRGRKLLSCAGLFYLMSVLCWGLSNALFYLPPLQGLTPSPFLYMLLNVGFILIAVELGWGAVHREMIALLCQVPIRVELGEAAIQTRGFIDTANHLRDPVTRQPVIIIDYRVIKELLSPMMQCFVEAAATGGVPPDLPPDEPGAERLRLIPFSTVQNRSGLLPGIRVDRIVLGQGERMVSHRSAVIGLETADGLQRGECRALVPPAMWSGPRS